MTNTVGLHESLILLRKKQNKVELSVSEVMNGLKKEKRQGTVTFTSAYSY